LNLEKPKENSKELESFEFVGKKLSLIDLVFDQNSENTSD
jgi:hypothetical protein